MEDLSIFISHKHDDKVVALAFKEQLESWGIPSANVFCSSSPEQGVEPGKDISLEIQNAILRSNLFILIHTYRMNDWSKCMIEYGIATTSKGTKVVILQCTEDKPPVYDGPLFTYVDESGIKDLVLRIHRTTGFIPGILNNEGEPRALADNIGDNIINSRSDGLFYALKKELPDGSISSSHLWDFLRVCIDSEASIQISKAVKRKLEKEAVISLIKESARIKKPIYEGPDNSSDAAIRQFGYFAYQNDLKLIDLIDRWIENIKEQSPELEVDAKWADDMFETIYQTASNRPQLMVNSSFKTLRADANWWFVSILTRIRTYPDHSTEYDVYLVRVPSEIF